MDEAQRERFSRQIRLPWIGLEGQQRLLDARVLIVGMGGLGSPAAMYLAAAGVGHLAISDFDRVDASNLQRQIIHRVSDIGSGKVDSARETLREINDGIRVTAISWQLEGDELESEVDRADVVLDCSDNFPTRFALNRVCVARGTPLVSGAAIRAEAQVVTFLPSDPESPCYRCLYEEGDEAAETCAAEGVVAPLVGIVGSIQAMEAVKIIVGAGRTLCGRLLLLDALTMVWRELRLPRATDCPVCSRRS